MCFVRGITHSPFHMSLPSQLTVDLIKTEKKQWISKTKITFNRNNPVNSITMKLSEFLKICFFVNLITVDHATSMDYQVVPSINLNRDFKLQIFGEKLFKINLSKEDCSDKPILIYIKTKILVIFLILYK